MVKARCDNDDCDREPWELTKRPADYAGGKPDCPTCGSTKTTLINAEAANSGAQRASGTTAVETAEGRGQQQQQPATPASQQPIDDEQAMAMGAQGANLLSSLNSEDPTTRAEAAGKGLKAMGSLLAQYGETVEQQKKQERHRAKNARSEDIEVAQEYPECPECGVQLSSIPDGEFPCPGCGVALRFEQ